MLTYEKIFKKPQIAKKLIGMSLSEFDDLFADFEDIHTDRQSGIQHTRHQKVRRQRAVGAGRKYEYDLRDRLLMTLFWLRAYMTYEVLGFFYDLDKTNIEDNLKGVLDTLEAMTNFNFERPAAERSKLRSAQEVMDAFPDVVLIIDAKEQHIERPANKKDKDGKVRDRQKPYYSGKKKTHTLKNQIAVAPNRADYPDKKLYLPFKTGRNHPLTEDQKVYNRFLSKYRIVVEHTNAQLNNYQVLAQRFRYQLEHHSHIFRIVCGLINRRIQLHPLKLYGVA